MKPVLAGLALGIAGALSLGQASRSLLFGVAPEDPLTLVLGLGLLGMVGLLVCVGPALRVTRIDPSMALRSE
jgi:ABC-type antimicrobial peptide transport system permease subunit